MGYADLISLCFSSIYIYKDIPIIFRDLKSLHIHCQS